MFARGLSDNEFVSYLEISSSLTEHEHRLIAIIDSLKGEHTRDLSYRKVCDMLDDCEYTIKDYEEKIDDLCEQIEDMKDDKYRLLEKRISELEYRNSLLYRENHKLEEKLNTWTVLAT